VFSVRHIQRAKRRYARRGRVCLNNHISLGVIARAVPPARARQMLAETNKASERERDSGGQLELFAF
jgi:hypothetical protein